MSAKIRHNKKRNTIFIYEALVRNLTKATIEKDFITRKQIFYFGFGKYFFCQP